MHNKHIWNKISNILSKGGKFTWTPDITIQKSTYICTDEIYLLWLGKYVAYGNSPILYTSFVRKSIFQTFFITTFTECRPWSDCSLIWVLHCVHGHLCMKHWCLKIHNIYHTSNFQYFPILPACHLTLNTFPILPACHLTCSLLDHIPESLQQTTIWSIL